MGGFQTGSYRCYALLMPTCSNHKIDVRVANVGDLDLLASVWHDSAANMDGAPSEMPSLMDLRVRIDRELAAGWELYLAERNHSVVGMLAIKPHETAIDQIFVLTGEQGSGVGLRLLETAKRMMPDGFTLRMAAANGRAARFYERAGLRVIGEGNHPLSGAPVRYYAWDGASGSATSLP